jgi:hypothetical protein
MMAWPMAHFLRRWVVVFSYLESCHLWRRDLVDAGLEYMHSCFWRNTNTTRAVHCRAGWQSQPKPPRRFANAVARSDADNRGQTAIPIKRRFVLCRAPSEREQQLDFDRAMTDSRGDRDRYRNRV